MFWFLDFAALFILLMMNIKRRDKLSFELSLRRKWTNLMDSRLVLKFAQNPTSLYSAL